MPLDAAKATEYAVTLAAAMIAPGSSVEADRLEYVAKVAVNLAKAIDAEATKQAEAEAAAPAAAA